MICHISVCVFHFWEWFMIVYTYMYTKMRVWISDEFVIKTRLAWEQTCSSGKVKYVTKIKEKTGSSNHGEDDDISSLQVVFFMQIPLHLQTDIEVLASKMKREKIEFLSLETWTMSLCIQLSYGSIKIVLKGFLEAFVSFQEERNFLICGSRYWQNSTLLHKLSSRFTLWQ